MNAEKKKFLKENFYGYETNETGESVWLFKESELVELMDKWKSVVCKEQREKCVTAARKKMSFSWIGDISVIENAPEPEI